MSDKIMEGKINCPCCGLEPKHNALWVLESIAREYKAKFNKALKINSGMRCEKHNTAVGGTKNSAHLEGLAFDLHCPTSQEKYLILKHLFQIGIQRIGVYKNFIHFDIATDKPQDVVWYS